MRLSSSVRHVVFVAFLVKITFAVAETLHGKVVAIADGDTLTLVSTHSKQVRIRLAGIDAPEKRQDFGQRAKENLSSLAYNREAIADCRKQDRYQRQVCVVTVDGVDVGLEQVKAGMAWWYRRYRSEQTPFEQDNYEQAETTAKTTRIGLWEHHNPIPPWNWRREQRR